MRTVLLKEMSTSKELVELSELYTNITERKLYQGGRNQDWRKKETDKDKEDAKKEGELEKVLTNLKNNKKDDKEEIKGPNVTGVVRNKNTGEIIRVDRDKNNLSKTDKEDLKKSVKTYHATDRSGRDFDDPGADSDVRGGSKERKPITQDIKGSDGKVVGKKTTHPASPDYQKTFENPKKVDTSKLPSEVTKGKEKEIAKANKPEVKVEPVKTKITARSQMRQRNIDRFGADKVNALMDKQKAFKSMQAKSMMPGAKPGAAKAEFAKNFPTSNVAKDLKKSKRVTQVMDLESYDAYDLVLNYIMESKQASTIEEANYIMVEMDQNTIYSIIKENTVNRADIIGGTKAAKNAQQGIGKYKPGVGVTKDFQLVPNFRIKA